MFACCRSDEAVVANASSKAPPSDATDRSAETSAKVPKIAIIFYSMYGHVTSMAESVKKGVESAGCKAELFQVPETLPAEVLKKMGAPSKPDYPIITPAQMTEYDGFLFGLSGRFGTMPAQMKAFFDSCGQLWMSGSLVGKPAGTFVSVGMQGGGQETVGWSCISFFAHNGMPYVTMGYVDSKVFSFEEVHGASPYGSGTFAASDGSRQPSTLEKDLGESHGKHFAGVAKKLAS